MNRIIHYTKGGSLNRAMHGLGDNNDATFLQESGSAPIATDYLDSFGNLINKANDSYKAYNDAQTVKMNVNMQRMLDSRPLPPPPSNSWTRLAVAPSNSVLMDNAKTIILVGGLAVAGLLLLKFISKNRK